ncbi:MAG: putative aminohydrolase SsnA [Acidobacteria bacterium]|nr:putative aminohydrolase SsnA [Acidobacteriota bacterium]
MKILSDTTIVQLNPSKVETDIDIALEHGRVLKTGKNLKISYPDAAIIPMDGKLVMPGMVCSHNHFYSALARGITADIPPSPNFLSILKNLWWRLDKAIDREILQSSAIVGALEAVKAGTTAVIDHHASPNFIRGSLNIIREAFEKVGLRGILCYETTDRNGETGMKDGIAENTEFAKQIDRNDDHRLVEATIGGHAPFTLNDSALEMMKKAIDETGRGIHVHVSEDGHDAAFSRQHYGEDPLARLQRFGLLNERALIVHGVHLTNIEISLLNNNDGFLIHNPRSNMNNSVGYMEKIHQIKNLAMGTDGIGADMFEEFKFAYFKHRDAGGSWWPDSFAKILQNGNRILERYFPGKFGHIQPGYRADFTILDYNSPTPLTSENAAGHLAFGMSSRDVDSVMVNGKFIYRDGKFPFDTDKIYSTARKAAAKLWKNM